MRGFRNFALALFLGSMAPLLILAGAGIALYQNYGRAKPVGDPTPKRV